MSCNITVILRIAHGNITVILQYIVTLPLGKVSFSRYLTVSLPLPYTIIGKVNGYVTVMLQKNANLTVTLQSIVVTLRYPYSNITMYCYITVRQGVVFSLPYRILTVTLQNNWLC